MAAPLKVPISEHAVISLDAPVLPAYERRHGGRIRWVVWCQYCLEWHSHGQGEGHREAHCNEATPYSATGYNLAFAGNG
jgi:hypothetical protein